MFIYNIDMGKDNKKRVGPEVPLTGIKKFDDFNKKFHEVRYTSMISEYKRSSFIIKRINLLMSIDETFNFILKFLKSQIGLTKDDLFEGSYSTTEAGNVYVTKYINLDDKKVIEINKPISVQGTHHLDYIITRFDVKALSNGFSTLKYRYTYKRFDTITGFNGHLGKIKFKRKANAQWEKVKKQFLDEAKRIYDERNGK